MLSVHRMYTRLGLRSKRNVHIYARIRSKSIDSIQAHSSEQATSYISHILTYQLCTEAEHRRQTGQPEDTSPRLDKEQTKFVQEVTGVFLFYTRAVGSTMLVALSAIAAEQRTPTENTLQ